MKERHDLQIQKPFPDDQETPRKEATLGESLRTLKRTKMMARRKSAKKPRVNEEEAEKDQKVAEEEGVPKSDEQEAQSQEEPSNTPDVNMYMVDTMKVDGKEYIRLKRKDDKFEVYPTWAKIVRVCSRSDLEEMFEVGMKLYADKLKTPGIPVTTLVMEYLCMLFKPEEVQHVIRNVFKTINNWTLYERSGVYALTMDTNHIEYFLMDRVYNHSRLKLHAMLKKKLGIMSNGVLGASEELDFSSLKVKLGGDCWELKICLSMITAASTTWLLLLRQVTTAEPNYYCL
ncbi:hypothetical protein L6452_34751 [Arctium lappa]|uniref:Uncharacterized protein n=1 Tax=Arctium lappa TaxID=4217 RepID=A0ACB8YK39_ARCLA|nr:hypothetical protein L6452_34751 [Arctium lappa]